MLLQESFDSVFKIFIFFGNMVDSKTTKIVIFNENNDPMKSGAKFLIIGTFLDRPYIKNPAVLKYL